MAGGITLYHFSGLVFKFNFHFIRISCQVLETELTSPEDVHLGSTFPARSKNIFPCKDQNFLKFFRKIACSSNKFPDQTFGPSSYLPNISHRQFSFRTVIKKCLKVLPGTWLAQTLRSQILVPIVYPLTAKLVQSAANKLGQIFSNQRSQLVCWSASL